MIQSWECGKRCGPALGPLNPLAHPPAKATWDSNGEPQPVSTVPWPLLARLLAFLTPDVDLRGH